MESKINTYGVDTSYEPYSREPEYLEANQRFLEQLPIQPGMKVLDLACGTLTISELLLQVHPNLTIMALDLSRESLELGQRDFIAQGYEVKDGIVLCKETPDLTNRLTLIEGSADCLPFRDGWADMVFMGNSIHMLPDFDLLLSEIRRVLVPGGLFAFNSAFYAGTQAPGTDPFYRIWWQKALEWVLAQDAQRKAAGLPGITRKRGTASRAKPWTSKDEWLALIQRHGFAPTSVYERPVMMTQSSLETIGSYSGLARLALSGYPVDLASEALSKSVKPAMEEAGMTEVPRLWLEIASRKQA
ncbi:MAG TPA: class I SAM-dependent methyltransferase [Kiritimatiellia bacterium]|nr:class I SAM-dependent methyltransferase [Kiritimatiellia bacterium]